MKILHSFFLVAPLIVSGSLASAQTPSGNPTTKSQKSEEPEVSAFLNTPYMYYLVGDQNILDQNFKEYVLEEIKKKSADSKGYYDRSQIYSDVSTALTREVIPVKFFDSAAYVTGSYGDQSLLQTATYMTLSGVDMVLMDDKETLKSKAPKGALILHQSTMNFLTGVSKKVFSSNLYLAAQLLNKGYVSGSGGNLSDPEAIDKFLLEREQKQIQGELDKLSAQTKQLVVNDLDRLMIFYTNYPGKGSYADQARREYRLATKNLKANLTFARLDHRILIGKHLKQELYPRISEYYRIWRKQDQLRKSGDSIELNSTWDQRSFWFRQGEHISVTATGTMQIYDETCTPDGVVAKTKSFWTMPIPDDSHYGTMIGKLGSKLRWDDKRSKDINKTFLMGTTYDFVAPVSGWINFGVNSGYPFGFKGSYKITARVTGRS